MTMTQTPRDGASERHNEIADDLVRLSHEIHAHPELGFEEENASRWLCESLSDAGFDVQAGACELETSILARAGSGPLHVAFVAEYDCLPEIGHACGHNVIATMSLGAAIAAAKVADEVGMTVTLVGTPAQELGGGKILMLERGAFDGLVHDHWDRAAAGRGHSHRRLGREVRAGRGPAGDLSARRSHVPPSARGGLGE